MIKIERINCPACLDTSNRNLAENDYQNDDVRDALLSMQHHKCCYCEKMLHPIGQAARWIDHFIPRKDNSFKDAQGNIDWNKANAWTNLLYACSTCNSSKGTAKPFDNVTGKRRLIDPSYSRIDPEKHIEFYIDENLIYHKERKRSVLGKNTIKNLKLRKRQDVYSGIIERKRIIDALFGEFIVALRTNNAVEANSKRTDLMRETSAHRPHASFCRKYVIHKVNKFNKQLPDFNQNFGTSLNPLQINITNGSEVIN